MTQETPFLFPVRTRELEAIQGALQGGRQLVQVCGPSGAGKSELLPILARATLLRPCLSLDLRLPLVPDLRAALLELLDPGGLGRSLLAEDAPALEFFCRSSPSLLLIDHAEADQERVAAALPSLLEGAPNLAAVVVCREPMPWPEAATVRLDPWEVPATPEDPRWQLLLEPSLPEQRAAWFSRPQALGRLWVRLGGLPRQLRLAAPALAELGPEGVLERLESHAPEALLALAWSRLSEQERDALGLLAMFSGGCSAEAYTSCGREVAVLHRLARSGWLRRLISHGEPRWVLPAEALSWLSSRVSFALGAERYCVEHMQCTAQRRMTLDRQQTLGLEQKNFWINVLRLEECALSIRDNAVLLGWLLDGLFCSHGSFPLLPEHCDRADALVDRLTREPSFRELGDMGPILLLHRAETLLANGQQRRALALLAPLEQSPLVGSTAVFLRIRIQMDRGELEGIVPEVVRLWEHHATEPEAEKRFLLQAISVLSQLGEVELVREILERLLSLRAGSGERPETLLELRFHALFLEGDEAVILEQERALAERPDLPKTRELVLWQFLAFAALLRGDFSAALSRIGLQRKILVGASQTGFLLQSRSMEGLAFLMEGRAANCRAVFEDLLRWLPARERIARSLLLGALALCEAREGDAPRSEALLRELEGYARPLRASREIASLLSAATRLAQGTAEDEVIAEGCCMPATLLARRLLRWQREETARQRDSVTLARDGSWWQGSEGRVSASNRPVLMALVAALCEARQSRPGVALDKETLVQSVWPAERRPGSPAATNRLHVALATLRKQGLSGALRSAREGWLLVPELTRLRDP